MLNSSIGETYFHHGLLGRARGHAVYVTARTAENDVERGENELFAARRACTCFARNYPLGADHGARGTFRLRFYFSIKILREVKAVAWIGAELSRFLFCRLFLGFALGLRRPILIVSRAAI